MTTCCDAPISAQCPRCRHVRHHFPSVTSIPPQTPSLRSQLCSPVSSVLRSHLTAHQRSCQPYPRRGSLTVLVIARRQPEKPMGSPGSRVWNVRACTGSQTPPYSPAPGRLRYSQYCRLRVRTGSAHRSGDFGAQWLACGSLRTNAQDRTVTRSAPPLKAEAVG